LGDRQDIWPIKKFIPVISGGSVLEQVEEKNPRENWLTQVHLEKNSH